MSDPVDRLQFQTRHGILGKSLEIRELVDTIMQVAPTDITVLLTGESGTGKEVVANAIHKASRRAANRFIAVNCGAIPEGILESELFGHEKGSFTGAIEQRKGYFEIADGGTIFLDEIGDTPFATQVKLLRVLENGAFFRVGSSEPKNANVRIIAATNKELEVEVQAKRFRQDLFFRLRSVNIRIPPLRNRLSDIPLFIEAFLGEARKKHGDNSIMLTDDAIKALQRYPWPGNVRELKNVIESIAVLEHGKVVDAAIVRKYIQTAPLLDDSRPLPVLLGKPVEQAERELIFRMLHEIHTELRDLRDALQGVVMPPRSLPLPVSSGVPGRGGEETVELNDISLKEMEKKLISHTLSRFEGNRRLAAQSLQISERTLYRKIQDYGLQ